MNPILIASAVVGGLAVVGAAGSFAGANKLYKKIIPRQDQCRVALSEMADGEKWERYIEFIHENKDWLSKREMEHITIKARDGITLHGDYIQTDGSADTIAVCVHGYTTTGFDACSSIATYFLKNGYDALIIDNRAHGKSEGDYVGFGILDRFDLIKWLEYLNERFEGKKNIILYGVSMGGSTVLMTAGLENFPKNVKAIIAECAFTTPYDVFAHVMKKDYHLPEFPIMKINDRMCRKNAGYGFKDYSTLTAVKSTDCPILFVHGSEDNFVPTRMSHENFEACTAPKELLIVENAGHAASYYESPELYQKKIEEFLGKYAPEVLERKS